MGTPGFAVPTLQSMADQGFLPLCVVTAPDKPLGRGLKVQPSPVKLKALELGLPVLQPQTLDETAFLDQVRALHPDLLVVVAFRKLPVGLLAIPQKGAINLHASLLPQYRGAAPINWALINGEKESGLTTFFIDRQIDTGKIIHQDRVLLDDEMNAGQLHDLLMRRGADLMIQTLRSVQSSEYQLIDQDEIRGSLVELKKAPKIFRENCEINWMQTARNVKNLIRGLCPSPGAYTYLISPRGEQFMLKIYGVDIEITPASKVPARLETDAKRMLRISSGDGYVYLREVQMQGKKIMFIDELLRGFPLNNDWQVRNSEGKPSEKP